jgi:hypothetical protein
MAKHIDDLVKDIDTMLDSLNQGQDIPVSEEAVKQLGIDMAEVIKDAFTSRGNGPRPKDRIAPTELGETCQRKLWYSRQPSQLKEKMVPHTYIKFLYGHLLECLVLFLARQAGHTVEREQEVIETQKQGVTIRGRIDAVIDGVCVDVKSASKFGFKKFQEGVTEDQDTFGYLSQIAAYQTATLNPKSAFLAINKESGKLCLSPVDKTLGEATQHVEQKVKFLAPALTADTEPEFQQEHAAVPHGKKNYRLSVKCSYCHFKHTCWKDSNDGQGLKGYIYSNGPVWLTQVNEEPRVPMITDKEKEK